MPALRVAITLRHSCWGLGRNRSRGWELDAAPGRPSLITSWGPLPPFFDSFSLFPSTDWLWELVRERPRRRRILGLDWEGPRRIRPSGMAWSLSVRATFIGKVPCLMSSMFLHGREDRYSGRMISAATQERNPFPPNTTGSLAPAHPLTTPLPAPHQSWFRAIFTQRGLGDMARLL